MPLPDRECPVCRFTFTPRRPEQTMCSVRCRNAHNARVSAAARGDAMRGKKRTGRGRYPQLGGLPAHRVVAEQTIGRPLKPGEVVHHLNGDKDDFSPHNVIVVSSQGAHAKLHRGVR